VNPNANPEGVADETNMASTLVKIDIHLIFHVKSTGVRMREADLPGIFAYIGGIINNVGGIPIEIGGRPDHVHILASLPKTMALADFARTIKANSSRWIKDINGYYAQFAWQEGYGAFSVSPSLTEKTVNYIRNQAAHHSRRSFEDEYKLFLEAYGIQYDERFLFSD
jgi:REP element-mobilizing transposase RayT